MAKIEDEIGGVFEISFLKLPFQNCKTPREFASHKHPLLFGLSQWCVRS